MRKILSFILPTILLLGIVVTGVYRITRTNELWDYLAFNMDIIVVFVMVLWLLFELWVSFRDKEKEKQVTDYGTRELYGFSQSITILSALWFDSQWTSPSIYHLVGFGLLICGISFRFWAIQTLGKYYSHIVRTVDHHKIIDTGPYRYLRHPAYAGMLMALCGTCIFYCNIVSVLIILTLLLPSIILRIWIEERTLFSLDGYPAYAENRKRLIPYVW
ncbi:MAG: isoprenylcysteine carboxylmethyltransferase family protein [Candidatus Thermoplasmatota archaeon]|nr:isoprenylcysteine carboxylmethyltransferase family protein [Candidatus Thermoplasmatota archaeon]